MVGSGPADGSVNGDGLAPASAPGDGSAHYQERRSLGTSTLSIPSSQSASAPSTSASSSSSSSSSAATKGAPREAASSTGTTPGNAPTSPLEILSRGALAPDPNESGARTNSRSSRSPARDPPTGKAAAADQSQPQPQQQQAAQSEEVDPEDLDAALQQAHLVKVYRTGATASGDSQLQPQPVQKWKDAGVGYMLGWDLWRAGARNGWLAPLLPPRQRHGSRGTVAVTGSGSVSSAGEGLDGVQQLLRATAGVPQFRLLAIRKAGLRQVLLSDPLVGRWGVESGGPELAFRLGASPAAAGTAGGRQGQVQGQGQGPPLQVGSGGQ